MAINGSFCIDEKNSLGPTVDANNNTVAFRYVWMKLCTESVPPTVICPEANFIAAQRIVNDPPAVPDVFVQLGQIMTPEGQGGATPPFAIECYRMSALYSLKESLAWPTTPGGKEWLAGAMMWTLQVIKVTLKEAAKAGEIQE